MEGDDARKAFEAALSFAEEYEFEEHPPPHAAHPLPAPMLANVPPLFPSHSVGESFAGLAQGLPLPPPLDVLPTPSVAPGSGFFMGNQTCAPGTALSPLQPGNMPAELHAAAVAAANPGNELLATTPASTASVAAISPAEELEKRRREERNARKRMLRKTGVYADPNRARDQRNREIAYLREKVEYLQRELSGLAAASSERRQHSHSTALWKPMLAEANAHEGSVGAAASSKECAMRQQTGSCCQESSRGGTMVRGVWQGVAVRQRERREKAERENARLKLVLESQIKVVTGLQGLLEENAKLQTAELSSTNVPKNTKFSDDHTSDNLTDMAELKDLLARIDKAYRDVDEVFDTNGLSAMETTHHDVHVRQGADGMSVEIFANKVMPFKMRATGDAMWNTFKGVDKYRGSLYEKATKYLEAPFTVVEDFSKELFGKSTRTDARIKQIVRRFVEDDREMVIRVMSASPIEIAHKPFAGLTFHQCGYALVKRAAASTAENELSLLQLCTILSLDKEKRTAGKPMSVRALTDFLLEYAAGNMRKHQELIENVLMDQSLELSTQSAAL